MINLLNNWEMICLFFRQKLFFDCIGIIFSNYQAICSESLAG
jgi:hypothetical protein